MATHPRVLAWRTQGRGSLVGCCLWGCTESDTTETTQQRNDIKYSDVEFSYSHIDIKYCYNANMNFKEWAMKVCSGLNKNHIVYFS